MAAKLGFAVACLGLVAFASGTFLKATPSKLVMGLPTQDVGAGILDSLALFNKNDIQHDDVEEMETALEKLVTKGDDPATKLAVKTMHSFIEKTLIKNRERAQAADQKLLDSSIQALKHCGLDRKVQVDMNIANKVNIANEHKEDYKDTLAKRGLCLQTLDGKKLVAQAYCSNVEADKTCVCDPQLNGVLSKFADRLDANCAKDHEIAKENKKCCDAYVEHAKHDAECDNHKNDAQFAQKQHKLIMSKVCKVYDTCYETRSKEYALVLKQVKKGEETRDWKSLYRIRCLVKAFDSEGKVSKDEAKACKDKEYDTQAIEYPSVPAKDECKEDLMFNKMELKKDPVPVALAHMSGPRGGASR